MARTAQAWEAYLTDQSDRQILKLDAQTWDYERRLNQVGESHYTLGRASPFAADAWKPAQRIIYRMGIQDVATGAWTWREDWGGITLGRRYVQTAEGAPSGQYRFTSYDWKHLLRGRKVIPPSGQEFMSLTSAHGDASMRDAVAASASAPLDATRVYRKLTLLTEAAQVLAGASQYSARYERLYDVITTLAGQSDCDFDVVRETAGALGTNRFLFRTYFPRFGKDRTIGSTEGWSPAVFSLDLQAILTLDYNEDASQIVNRVYNLGDGEAAARVVGQADDLASQDVWDLWEDTNDVRGAGTAAAAIAAGKDYMAAHKDPDVSLSFTLPQADGLVYGLDWDLGDLVSVSIPELSVSGSMQVTAIRVSRDGDNPVPTITPTFGALKPSILSRIADLTRGLVKRQTV